MRKKLFTFLVALVAGIGLCWADESGSCGTDLTYEFNSSTGELTISGTGIKMDYIAWEWMEWKKQVTSVSLPENLTIIDGYQAFADFKISSITLPEGLTSLGESLVFHRCTSLTSIVLPAGISTIPQSTFLKCTSLATVTLPAALTSIGYGAFMSCYALNTIYCYAENPPTLGNDVFLDDNTWQPMDLSNVTLYVPYGSIAAYQAADGWSSFGTIAAIPGTEPAAPADEDITANPDPQNAGVYYSTFFDSANKYALPAGVEAYVATVSSNALNLTKIAGEGQTIPADNAVILKSSVANFTLAVSDAAPVSFTATNSLQGSDEAIATPDNCYVLSGEDGVVGFYRYTGADLNAHKAYVVYSGSQSVASRRMPFVFNEEQTATGVESEEAEAGSRKVMENGRLVIIRNGVRYDAQGQVIE